MHEPVTVKDAWGGFTIEAGFRTDLASVPRILWGIFPPYGKHLRAAVVHDYLYRTRKVARARADAVFLDIMAHYGAKRWKRRCMYLAVRVGGWMAYGG